MSSKKHSKKLLSKFLSTRVSESVTPSAIQAILQGLDCPRSLAVWIIIRDDPAALKTLTFNPNHYIDMVACRDAYTATKLVSKAKFLKTGLDLDEIALEKFHRMELLCKQTNSRFRHLLYDPSYRGRNVWLLNAFIRKIESVLVGYSPEELFGEANWGPGVSTLIKGENATSANKFQCETGITRDLHDFVSPLLEKAYPMWSNHLTTNGFPNFQVGNKVDTVPKDAFTNRVIAVEPGFNLWFQKAIGSMIRKRLRVHGIELNYQDRNQQLARKGSLDSSLATVDFSSASDTISKELVRAVLPPHWLSLMEVCRSHCGFIEDKLVHWEKFSSMGNGFTFELESLIFYSAAFVCCEYLKLSTQEVSVYGDDVLLPSHAFDLFSEFSTFLGFQVNPDKSFDSSSPFRESCGSYYYSGVDIKPIFIKNIARNLFDLYKQLNRIRELSHRRLSNVGCDSILKPAWLLLLQAVPRDLRLYGPSGKGDGSILSNFDEATPVRARDGIEGYYFRQFAQIAVKQSSEEVGLFLARLRNRSTQEHGNSYALRGRTRVILIVTLVSLWYDLGPWI